MLINAALAANDRSKYYFTLLQTAVMRAQRLDSQDCGRQYHR